MLNRFVPAIAALAFTLAPVATHAQVDRASSLPSYGLVQLSVASAQVTPQQFATATAAIRSCGEAKTLAAALGAQVLRHRFVYPSELPPQLRPIVADLGVGKATPVLSEDGTMLHVLVVCSRA